MIIKRHLTTSFFLHANSNKGFYNVGFPKTHKYFKEIIVKPGYIFFYLHQSAFNFEVQVSKQTAKRFNTLSYLDLTNLESKYSPKQVFN